jgi:tetratricopeptide (TPR) repeat protein
VTYTSEIEKLERRWSENPKGRNFAPLADAYRKAGELDRAIELCTAGLERHPDYVSAHIVFGRCLMDQKNDAGAADVFRKVLALDPENVLALKILGEIAVRGNRYDEAVDWLTRLLAADPMNGEAADMLIRVKSKAAQQAAPSPAPGARAGAAEPVVQFVPAAAAARPASTPATVRTAAPAAGPAGRATAPAPPRSRAPQADFIVEHVSDRPAPPDPVAASADKEIEIFDGAVDFNSVAHDAAKAEGLEVQEEVELKPQDYVVEGLARTQYESAMYARPPESSEPEDEQPTIELPLIMPDDVDDLVEVTAPAATPEPAAPAAPTWAAPRGPAATARPPTPTPPPPPPPAPPPTPAAVALSDDDGAADTAALSRAEPVLTETMAELYLRQGHEENALRVYQALLAQRPADARLRARVAELTSGGTGHQAFAAERGRGTGESVQTFLRRILAGRPGMPGASSAPTPEPVPAPSRPPPRPPPAPPPVFADSPLDGAFAIAQPEPEPVLENRSPGPGEATRPAEDSISLDSVFGEETLRMSAPAAEPPEAAPAAEPAGPPTTGGFSFDQFFGPAGPTQAGAAGGGTGEPKGPPRTTSQKTRAVEDEGDLDQFQAWLRGLKS